MEHNHYYDRALSEWQCRECDTAADYCTAEPVDDEEVLRAAQLVMVDVNSGADDDEKVTIRGAALHARNTLRLPEEAPVMGAYPLDDDGTELAAAYRLILTVPDAAVEELPDWRYSTDDLAYLRSCIVGDGIDPDTVDLAAVMDAAFVLWTDMADGETGYAERDDVDLDAVIARYTRRQGGALD